MATKDYEASTFQKRPAYRYIRHNDKLPLKPVGDDPIAKVKIFDPTAGWTWYLASYDHGTRVAFGLVDGFEREIGDVYMPELVAFRGRFNLPIERDLHWKPRPFSQITGAA